jgi:hypothetical protein
MGLERKTALTTAVLLCLASGAHAQPAMTGNQLHEACSSGNSSGQLLCVVYVRGIAEGSMIQHALESRLNAAGSPTPFCSPAGSTWRQLTDVVARALAAQPQNRHRPAADITLAALMDAFPCDPSTSR